MEDLAKETLYSATFDSSGRHHLSERSLSLVGGAWESNDGEACVYYVLAMLRWISAPIQSYHTVVSANADPWYVDAGSRPRALPLELFSQGRAPPRPLSAPAVLERAYLVSIRGLIICRLRSTIKRGRIATADAILSPPPASPPAHAMASSAISHPSPPATPSDKLESSMTTSRSAPTVNVWQTRQSLLQQQLQHTPPFPTSTTVPALSSSDGDPFIVNYGTAHAASNGPSDSGDAESWPEVGKAVTPPAATPSAPEPSVPGTNGTHRRGTSCSFHSSPAAGH
jgi:hypothetical protein